MTYPFGPDAVGYYIFSESGYMSVSLMPSKRRKFAAGDIMGGSIEEKVAAAETYISYSGKYEIQGDKLVVHAEVGFFPNWMGVDQVRILKLAGNSLTLSTPPLLARGVQQTAHLVWERV
jgi:Lipocalin-like domain